VKVLRGRQDAAQRLEDGQPADAGIEHADSGARRQRAPSMRTIDMSGR
jgi:hypothetical protein